MFRVSLVFITPAINADRRFSPVFAVVRIPFFFFNDSIKRPPPDYDKLMRDYPSYLETPITCLSQAFLSRKNSPAMGDLRAETRVDPVCSSIFSSGLIRPTHDHLRLLSDSIDDL
jgi:hypothetical protein